MRAVQDLPPIDPTTESEFIKFDFYPFLPDGVTLTGTPVVVCSVSAASQSSDLTPSARLIGSPTITTVLPPDGAGVFDTAVIQHIGNCVAGVLYLLQVSCIRSDGAMASLWVQMPCKAPI